MKRVLLLLVALAVLTGVASALQVQTGNITIDGNVSEWAGNATVLTYRSLMNPVEMDSFYFLHNATHYLIGARLYDNDNATDEWLNFYLYNGVRTILVQVHEGNDTAVLYDVSGDTLTKLGEVPAVATKSVMGKVKNPYVNVELAVPKTYLDNATNVKVFIERKAKLMRGMLVGCWCFAKKVRFMHGMATANRGWEDWMDKFSKIVKFEDYADVVGGYPLGATKDNPDTWANLTFVDTFGTNTLHLTLPVLAGVTTIEIYNGTSTNAPLLTVLPASTSVTVNVPSNVTIVVNVSGVPVLTKTYSINVSLNDTLNPNVKTVDTGFAKTTIAVEEGANFTAYFDRDINGTVVTIYSNNTVKVFVESTTRMVVLSAEYIAYNPITNRSKFSVSGNDTVIIKYPKYSCILSADKLEDCEFIGKDHLRLKVGNGTVIIQNPNLPFAIADDGVAMKRDIDYVDNDGGNITLITTNGGTLDVYYANPCNMSVRTSNGRIIVSVATPYSFNGLVNVSIAGKVVASKKVFFRAPYTEVTVELGTNITGTTSLASDSGAVVTVKDLDSKQTIGTATVSYMMLTPLQIALILVAVVGVVIIAIMATRKSKHIVRERMEKDFKFFRRL